MLDFPIEDYPEDDDFEDNYKDPGMEIFADTLDKDFDEINFDGEVDDDSDEDAADLYDY